MLTWRPQHRSRCFVIGVFVILGTLAVGPATTPARRAAARGRHPGSVHHRHSAAWNAGLVSAWGFGGGSGGTGTTIADASGHGNALMLVNATLTSAGKYGGAVQFTGQESLAIVPATGNLNLRSGMTLEAWVRPSKLAPGHATIIAKTRPGGGFPYGLELTGGRPDAYGVIGRRFVKGRAKVRLPRSRWSFLAATYDGSMLRLYVGDRVAAHLAVRGMFRKSAGALQIGGDQVRREFFSGSIDNVRIFSKARSSKQLARDRRTRVAGGIIHRPVSTTTRGPSNTAPGSTAPRGTGSPSRGTVGVGPIGIGASAGIGLPPRRAGGVHKSERRRD